MLRQHVFQFVVCVLGGVQRAQHAVHAAPHPVHTPQTETHAVATLQNLWLRIFTDYFYKSVTLAKLSVSSLRMVQMDRIM